jgi:hypothetical protein
MIVIKKSLKCPVCNSISNEFNINVDLIKLLERQQNQGTLQEFLTITKCYAGLIEQGTPTANLVAKATNAIQKEIKKSTLDELAYINIDINNTIQTTLQQILHKTIPDSRDFETLNRILPELTLTIHKLIQTQTKPTTKGQQQELQLHQELTEYYPDDLITHQGGPGKTDITIQPRFNGKTHPTTIIVESKNNATWSRSFITQVQKHMAAKKTPYAILAVQTMPRGAPIYHTETTKEGIIYITQVDNTKLVYGALRTILKTHGNTPRTKTLAETIQEKQIQEAINKAYTTSKYLENIRKHVRTIQINNDKILTNTNQADTLLKTCLNDMQTNIQHALTQEQQITHPM